MKNTVLLVVMLFFGFLGSTQNMVQILAKPKVQDKSVIQDQLLSLLKVKNVSSQVPDMDFIEAKAEFDRREIRFIRFQVGGDKAGQVMEELKNSGLYEYVEADVWGGITGDVIPNDPNYYRQWNLRNTGTRTGSKYGADIEISRAWEIEKGDTNIVVGFLDTGCKYDHPDLNGRIWVNWGEIPGNGVDDDQNGYVDDINGWNTYNNSNDIRDYNAHGTLLNGIVGAIPDNQFGYAGVDWNCKLMNVVGVTNQGQGISSWWAEGIYYMVDNGVDVINMSLSTSVSSQTLKDAVDYAYGKGVVIVAATGNNNTNYISYPAKYDKVIAVGATDHADYRATWSGMGSNYGPEIDLVAPGKAIYGLYYASDTYMGYVTAGTSMAAPQVTGVVSLLLAQKPGIGPDSVFTILKNSVEDQVGPLNEDAAGFDQYFGWGRLNAYQALNVDNLAGMHEVSEQTAISVYPNPFSSSIYIKGLERNDMIGVYHITGKEILYMEVLEQINLDFLDQGAYIIKTEKGFSEVILKK